MVDLRDGMYIEVNARCNKLAKIVAVVGQMSTIASIVDLVRLRPTTVAHLLRYLCRI